MTSSTHRRRHRPTTSARDRARPTERTDSYDPTTPDGPTTGPTTLTPEDLDDSIFFRRRETRRASPRFDHKDRQLCAQVAELLAVALAELDDPVLAGLAIAGVAMAHDAGRLVVTVIDPSGSPADEVVARLARLRGHLRAEIAAGITRKRVPDVTFVVGVAEEAWP
ncbi:MAG: hypothetical protein R3B06_24215 [Kofleriaceae bacterium]